MTRIFKITMVLSMALLFAACPKDDAPRAEVVIPYAFQYPIDRDNIEAFLNQNTMIVSPDFDVTFKRMEDGDVSIMDQTTYPIQSKIINNSGIDYKLYYIPFREGEKDQPTAEDSIFVSYKGDYIRRAIDGSNAVSNFNFETVLNPTWFRLSPDGAGQGGVIRGWQEMFIMFKSGFSSDGGSGQTLYSDFGAGVFFLPSALAYYNRALSSIPAYSPLIFSFKLKGTRYTDYDRDGVLSKDEDINNDGFLNNDDTDGDGIPNYADIDDDGDGIFTRDEIRKPTPVNIATQGARAYYPYKAVLVDDPTTPLVNEYEPKGIPDASGDGTTPTRLRRHLDKTPDLLIQLIKNKKTCSI